MKFVDNIIYKNSKNNNYLCQGEGFKLYLVCLVNFNNFIDFSFMLFKFN